MQINKSSSVTQYILEPGDYYVSNKNVVIRTLLGSCVSACLFDPVNRVMAMNHFLLSEQKYKNKGSLITSDEGRYGIHAMELIINGMIKIGANKKHIKAKAFGGGNVIYHLQKNSTFFNIGKLNIMFIREFLETEKIPLVSSDLGGSFGRVILFLGSDYSVYVRKIEKSQAANIARRDKKYWDTTLQRRQQRSSEVEIWKK